MKPKIFSFISVPKSLFDKNLFWSSKSSPHFFIPSLLHQFNPFLLPILFFYFFWPNMSESRKKFSREKYLKKRQLKKFLTKKFSSSLLFDWLTVNWKIRVLIFFFSSFRLPKIWEVIPWKDFQLLAQQVSRNFFEKKKCLSNLFYGRKNLIGWYLEYWPLSLSKTFLFEIICNSQNFEIQKNKQEG